MKQELGIEEIKTMILRGEACLEWNSKAFIDCQFDLEYDLLFDCEIGIIGTPFRNIYGCVFKIIFW